MEQNFKYSLDELASMDHQTLCDKFILLASSQEELSAALVMMRTDYRILSEDKKKVDDLLVKLSGMLPSILKQLDQLESRLYGRRSKSLDRILNKKIGHKELFSIMKALLEELEGMTANGNGEKKDKKEKEKEPEKKEGKKQGGAGAQGGTDENKKEPEEAQQDEQEPKKQETHKEGNPNLLRSAKELCEYVGGSLDNLIVMVDPIFRTEEELKKIVATPAELSKASILSDAQFYFSLEYILGNVYPCLHVSVMLKNKGETIRNCHCGTIADRCLCSPSLAAMLLDKRFNLSVPTARSEAHEFPLLGLTVPRNSAYEWMDICSERFLKYINSYMLEKMMQRDVLLFDETYGKTRESGRYYYWDCRTSENESTEQLISYFYSRSHSSIIAKFLTHGFQGYLCADGLEAYETIACQGSGIKLCNCWNHARSYLLDAHPGREAVNLFKGNAAACEDYRLLEECLSEIGAMFELEKKHKKGDQTVFDAVRKGDIFSSAQKVMANLKAIKANDSEYKYNSVFKKAVDYVLDREENLLRFKEDIRIPLSTNSLESKHALVALGRNNFFLFDSDDGASNGSHCYAVASKARMDEVMVRDYMEFLLEILPPVLTMHMPEVIRFDIYEEKALKMVEEALEWQKKHPGKRASLDFSSLGERPSLDFLEPYLSGTPGCLFEKWQKAKNEYRADLLAKSAHNISMANLAASGLPKNVLERIVDCGLNKQDLKDDLKKGLEKLKACLEDFHSAIDPTLKHEMRFHPAFVYETTKGQDGSEPVCEDGQDPAERESPQEKDQQNELAGMARDDAANPQARDATENVDDTMDDGMAAPALSLSEPKNGQEGDNDGPENGSAHSGIGLHGVGTVEEGARNDGSAPEQRTSDPPDHSGRKEPSEPAEESPLSPGHMGKGGGLAAGSGNGCGGQKAPSSAEASFSKGARIDAPDVPGTGGPEESGDSGGDVLTSYAGYPQGTHEPEAFGGGVCNGPGETEADSRGGEALADGGQGPATEPSGTRGNGSLVNPGDSLPIAGAEAPPGIPGLQEMGEGISSGLGADPAGADTAIPGDGSMIDGPKVIHQPLAKEAPGRGPTRG